jgi:hypothetical protein
LVHADKEGLDALDDKAWDAWFKKFLEGPNEADMCRDFLMLPDTDPQGNLAEGKAPKQSTEELEAVLIFLS